MMPSHEQSTVEEWRVLPGAEGFYSVSNLGRVRSEPLPQRTTGRQRGRILQTSADSKGYRWFRVCIPGRRPKPLKVHRAVALAFLGPPLAGQQVNHRNGIKTDNRVANLEYVSCRENIRHCWANGLHGVEHCRGEANPNTPLTAQDVGAIRSLHPTVGMRELASRYGVTTTTIRNILDRKTWAHV